MANILALVVTFGRSGSTLLMRALAAHPRITVRNRFPYEERGSQYFFACAQAARKAIDLEPIEYHGVKYELCSGGDTQLMDATREYLGATPRSYGRNLAVKYHSMLAALEGKAGSDVIAEKAVGQKLAKEVFDRWPSSRVIVLIRDPRDTFLSILSFNAKRGYLSFGEEFGHEFLFEAIVEFYKHAQQNFLKRGARTCVTHYEDLLSAPDNEIGKVFDFLNLEANGNVALDVSKSMHGRNNDVRGHSTSDSAKESVGRWREEVGDKHRALFARFLPDIKLMSMLGDRVND